MIILRQKEFSWFGFGRKKEEPKKLEYKCPKFSDLPTNLQQGLRGVDRVLKKPETKKLIDEYKKLVRSIDDSEYVIHPFIDQKDVEWAWKEYISRGLSLYTVYNNPLPEETTLMYPLISFYWDYDSFTILCYDISTKKFWWVVPNDYTLEEVDNTNLKNINDFLKSELNSLDPDNFYIEDEDQIKQFNNLKKKIKKAFWI